MRRSGMLWGAIGLAGSLLASGCDHLKACPEPFEQRACECGSGAGVQMCLPERVWGECECADAGSDAGAVGGTGGASGAGAGAGASGSAAAGSAAAGSGASGGMSGAAAGTGGSVDGGPLPAPDGGADSGPMPGGSGGGGGTGGSGPAADPYRACTMDGDCDSGGTCVMDSVLLPPADVYVCASACADPSECATPAGTFEATVACAGSLCRLECTPEFLGPDKTCPSGMSCFAENGGLGPASYCFRD